MNQKILQKLNYIEFSAWIILITLIYEFIYQPFSANIISIHIIESILIIILIGTLINLRDIKNKIKIQMLLRQTFGKRKIWPIVIWIYFGIAILFIIGGLFSFHNLDYLIEKVTFGIIWIIIGLGNRYVYYIEITKRNIIKNNTEYLKINKIKNIEFSNEVIHLKTSKSSMSIYLHDLEMEEQSLIINYFKELKLKNNLA
jgi:hypothetical protein